MQNNCLEINDKLSRQKEKYKRAALMLTEFLEDLMSQKPNILKEQAKFALNSDGATQDAFDIERIQSMPIEELSRDDKVRVVFILLKQLQPFISAQNLSANQSLISKQGPTGARSVGMPIARGSIGATSSIDNNSMPYRSTGAKQPLSNNFVNRSLQGGLPTQAETMSAYGAGAPQPGAYAQSIGVSNQIDVNAHGGETIQTQKNDARPGDLTDPNGVSLTNLLTNIKV